jgi:hypothetical protein
VFALVVEDVGERIERGARRDGINGAAVGFDGAERRVESLAAEGEGFAHGSVRRAEQHERVDLARQARAKEAIRVPVADLAAPRIDVRRDETAHGAVLLFGTSHADAFLLEVRAQLERVGVVGAAGVGRGAHGRARELVLDPFSFCLVARAVEEKSLVELVGQPAHDGDRDFSPGFLRGKIGDFFDRQRAREAGHHRDERGRDGRHFGRHAFRVAEHHGLSEAGVGYEDGLDGAKARALDGQGTYFIRDRRRPRPRPSGGRASPS